MAKFVLVTPYNEAHCAAHLAVQKVAHQLRDFGHEVSIYRTPAERSPVEFIRAIGRSDKAALASIRVLKTLKRRLFKPKPEEEAKLRQRQFFISQTGIPPEWASPSWRNLYKQFEANVHVIFFHEGLEPKEIRKRVKEHRELLGLQPKAEVAVGQETTSLTYGRYHVPIKRLTDLDRNAHAWQVLVPSARVALQSPEMQKGLKRLEAELKAVGVKQLLTGGVFLNFIPVGKALLDYYAVGTPARSAAKLVTSDLAKKIAEKLNDIVTGKEQLRVTQNERAMERLGRTIEICKRREIPFSYDDYYWD